MPRRKKSVTEEVPQQDVTDVVEKLAPTQEDPEIQAEKSAPDLPEKPDGSEEIFNQLHEAKSRQDLMKIWAGLTVEQQSSAEIRDAFQKRQADISLAGGDAQ